MSEFDQIANSILLGSQAINNIVTTMGTVTFGWQAWTATITPASGSFSTTTNSPIYFQAGPLLFIRFLLSVTNVGTAVSPVTVSLPFTLTNFHNAALSYADTAGGIGFGFVQNATTFIWGPAAALGNNGYIISGLVI